ncbi:MAG: hypothetical protein R6U94_06490 [Nitriliruptoraceae bacterium]
MTAAWQPLAEALIRAMQPELPPGFHARLDTAAGGIALFATNAPLVQRIVGVRALIEQPGCERQLVELACRSVLSNTQDFIAESTSTPWPGEATELPLPDVEVTDTEIWLCYGQRATPTRVIGPIRR